MIRQQAFIDAGKFLKGGLHCHTTRSDGDLTPEEVMKLHKEHNYDFLAITDHRVYNRKNFVPETGITIIPGMEIDATIDHTNGFRCFHTVCLGLDDESNGFAHDEEYPRPNDVKNQYDFQKYLDDVHSKNNITFYCHPQWSSTPARYYENLKGEIAMEVWNSGCALAHEMDNNAAYWDEILGQGKKLWGVAVDDGHAFGDHCNGWVMVNAENNVKSILDALVAGKFYSSCGPVIKDFYVINGVAHVYADDCKSISFCADKHPARKFTAEGSELLNHAELDLNDSYEYVRVMVKDAQGRQAWTNPIFLK